MAAGGQVNHSRHCPGIANMNSQRSLHRRDTPRTKETSWLSVKHSLFIRLISPSTCCPPGTVMGFGVRGSVSPKSPPTIWLSSSSQEGRDPCSSETPPSQSQPPAAGRVFWAGRTREGHELARSGSGTACGASRQRGSSHSGTIWRRVWPRSPGASGWEARCASNCSLHMFEQIPVGRWRDNVCWAGRPVPCKLHAPSPSPFNLYLCSCV